LGHGEFAAFIALPCGGIALSGYTLLLPKKYGELIPITIFKKIKSPIRTEYVKLLYLVEAPI
jgi:hypothetical protein